MIGQMPRSRAACRLALASYPLLVIRGTGLYVGSDIEQELELTAVAGFAAGQVEVERIAFESAFRWIFVANPPRERPSAAALPFLAPAAETWPRTMVLSNIWTGIVTGTNRLG
jgi:hypothetical protein